MAVVNYYLQESEEEGDTALKPEDLQAGLITPEEGGLVLLSHWS